MPELRSSPYAPPGGTRDVIVAAQALAFEAAANVNVTLPSARTEEQRNLAESARCEAAQLAINANVALVSPGGQEIQLNNLWES